MKAGGASHSFSLFHSLRRLPPPPASSALLPACLPACLLSFRSFMITMQQSFRPSSMMIEPAFASTASLWPSSFLLGIAPFDYHRSGVADGSGAMFSLERKPSSGQEIAPFDYHRYGLADGSGAMFSLERKPSSGQEIAPFDYHCYGLADGSGAMSSLERKPSSGQEIASFDYHRYGLADGPGAIFSLERQPSYGEEMAPFDYHRSGVADGSRAMFSLKRKPSSDEEDIGKIHLTAKVARSSLSSTWPRCHSILPHENHANNSSDETRPADLEAARAPHVAIKQEARFYDIVNTPPEEADRIRTHELHRVLSHKKLHLVLDLDHTLLNSAGFANVSPVEEDYLRSLLLLDGGMHRLERLRMWTKLRPSVRQFLAAASEMYEMCVYTMGNRPYADAMARLLDPDGSLFGGRIISRSESRCPRSKDLDVTYLSDTATVILDDTPQVWPRHKRNVVVMERYHFFESSPRSFTGSAASISSMSELRTDESEHDGALSDALSLLRQVHAAYFHGEYVDASGRRRKYGVGGGQLQDSNIIHGKDVREILREMRKSVLSGCKIVFSRVFPTKSSHPNTHPCWRLSEDLGAKCATEVDETVTHVVALDGGTDKARWAIREGRHLVHPRWIDAAFFCRRRPDESCFSVFDPPSMTTPHFTKTVAAHAQSSPAAESQAKGRES